MSALTSLTSADLLVSLRVPVGWEAEVVDEGTFRVRGGAEGDDYRPTLTVERGVPERAGHAWFEEFAAGVPLQMGPGTGLQMIDLDRYRLSSLDADVLVVSARRTPGSGDGLPPTSQLQAWVWAGSHRMVVLGGSTDTAHEERDLPVLAAMVASLRLLPPRPTATP